MTKRKEPQTVFGQRLRHVRQSREMAQDRLGVAIGIDEAAASARVSRYETGTHEPPYDTALLIAKVLGVQVAYFYADDDDLAELILKWVGLTPPERQQLLAIAQKNGPQLSA
jgi:transcriptional regulator with XRE-family HTH domain